jgi:GNAT superfamily N-acetyltransferase
VTPAIDVVTAAERPDLVELWWEATKDAFPEYNNHGDVLNRYWGRLVPERPDFQFFLTDGGEPVVRACSIPVRWDGTVAGLPAGIDGAIARGFDEDGADTLCALLIAVAPAHRGRGLSRIALETMGAVARAHGFGAMIAPVRPSWKERYPFTPIDRYAAWHRDDGLLFDPWMRAHGRLGADVLLPEPRSLRITGTVAEWEEWTGLAFPESGEYVFPRCLALLQVDLEADLGSYWEPNVWMRHPLDGR